MANKKQTKAAKTSTPKPETAKAPKANKTPKSDTPVKSSTSHILNRPF